MKVIVVDVLPDGRKGRYVHYTNARLGGSAWERCEAGPIIREHQERWLDDIDRWHRSVSRAAIGTLREWWLVPGSRITAWYPLDLRPLMFALAVMELCAADDEYGDLHVVGGTSEVVGYLREFAGERGVIVEATPRADTAAEQLPSLLQWARGTGRQLLSLLGRSLAGGKRRAPVPPGTLIVISQTLSADTIANVGDHFFGRVFDDRASARNAGVRWLYMLSNFRERDAVRATCESMGRTMRFGFELLRIRDVAAIIVESLWIGLRARRIGRSLTPLTVGRFRSRVFSKRFAARSIGHLAPVTDLAVYHALKRYLRAVRPAAVLYPYEEKATERAILRACSEHSERLRTVAFAHAAFTIGHLYLRPQDDLGRPRPTVIGATGPAARDWLQQRVNLPEDRTVVIGSPRFAEDGSAPPTREEGGRLRVLFLTGFADEIERLATLAEETTDLFHGADLIIRRYPHGWFAEQAAAHQRLEQAGVAFRVEQGSLAQQIAWADVVLFASTSAGIESMLRSRITLRVVGDSFDADPLDGKDEDRAVPRCETGEELKRWLTTIDGMDSVTYARLAERQRAVASRIYASWDAEGLTTTPLSDARAPERVAS